MDWCREGDPNPESRDCPAFCKRRCHWMSLRRNRALPSNRASLYSDFHTVFSPPHQVSIVDARNDRICGQRSFRLRPFCTGRAVVRVEVDRSPSRNDGPSCAKRMAAARSSLPGQRERGNVRFGVLILAARKRHASRVRPSEWEIARLERCSKSGDDRPGARLATGRALADQYLEQFPDAVEIRYPLFDDGQLVFSERSRFGAALTVLQQQECLHLFDAEPEFLGRSMNTTRATIASL